MSTSPNREAGYWRTGAVATTATTFRPLTGLQSTVCSTGEVAAMVSVNGVGSPMDLQVHMDGGPILQPGRVTFSPTPSGSMAMFTFLISTSAFEANDHHMVQVERRSTTGRQTSVRSATLNLLYREGTHQC